MNQRRLHSDTPSACTVKSGKKLSAAATPPTDALHDAMLVTVPDDLPDSLDKRIDRKTMMSAHTYHKKILRSHPMISADLRHPLRHVSDYPGLMCLHRLRSCQALDQLDDNIFFPARFSATSFMRVHVVRDVIPEHSIASGLLAAWIWLGGRFPGRIDVMRDHNYHSILFGRKVRSSARQIHHSYLYEFADLLVTTPEITACDLACSEDARKHPEEVSDLLVELAQQYNFTEHDCLELMRENTRRPRYTAGLHLLIRALNRPNYSAMQSPQPSADNETEKDKTHTSQET